MVNTIEEKKSLKGGEFLLKDSSYKDTFIPEEMNEDQQMVRDMVLDFIKNEIYPIDARMEKLEDGLNELVLEKAAALGLLGTHMPEAYGGLEMDTNTNTVITDYFGSVGNGFTVTYAVQTGIGMLPLLYFGTEEQKQKYLVPAISAEKKVCYCLTEPSSGSDALSAKTRADLSEDGKHYIINGQKMWISSSGFADTFIVFAQVDGDKFTGFIVDGGTPGLTLGAEEEKMGIHASSTRQVFFENVKVPADNVLGKIGEGHKIAFNVLNVGRYKLGAMCVGGARRGIDLSVKYANERNQFRKPIASFGAIKHKLGEQTIRLFAVESALYRASHLMQELKHDLMEEGKSFTEATLISAEEYAMECAILKVIGSEMSDYVVDEAVQIHGGMGFSEETAVSRAYRDSRISRIYEGTNEINRLLTVNTLMKRVMKQELDFLSPAMAVQKELMEGTTTPVGEGKYGQEEKTIKDFKKAILMVLGSAAKLQMEGKLNLKEEQEIVMNISDMIMDTFVAESLLLRIQKLSELTEKPQSQEIYDAILKVYFTDMNAKIAKDGMDAIVSFAEGDAMKGLLSGLRKFTKYPPINVKKARRLVADTLIEANGYCL